MEVESFDVSFVDTKFLFLDVAAVTDFCSVVIIYSHKQKDFKGFFYLKWQLSLVVNSSSLMFCIRDQQI